MTNPSPQFTFSTIQPKSQNLSGINPPKADSQFYFNKKMMGVDEYSEMVENSAVDLKLLQHKLDKDFFKQQLKATLYLNYQLIKLYSIQEQQLERLKQQITLSTNQLKKSQQRQDFSYCTPNVLKENMNYHVFTSSHLSPLKSPQSTEEYHQITHLLHSDSKHSCEECTRVIRVIEHKQEMIRANQQQNEYLRRELIRMTEKMALQSIIKKRDLPIQRACQTSTSDKYNGFNLRMINCSPIRKSEQFHNGQEEISFNNDYFGQSNLEMNKIKEELQLIKSEFYSLQEEHQKYKRQNVDLKTQQIRLKAKYEEIFLNMNEEYREIKEQLQQRLVQVQRYKKMIIGIKQIAKFSRNHEEKNNILRQQIVSLRKEERELKKRLKQHDEMQQTFNKARQFLINQSNECRFFIQNYMQPAIQ